MQKIYRVVGMSCAACASSVESILQAIEGVISAKVNLTESSVWVEFDPLRVSFDQMKLALEQVGYSLEEDTFLSVEDDEEQFEKQQKKLRLKVAVAFIFSIPVFILSMFFHHAHHLYILQAIFTLPVIWAGWHMISIGFKRLLAGHSTMDSLVALGTMAAFVFSLIELLLVKMEVISKEDIHLYFESSAIIIAFVLLGKYFEERAKRNTGRSLKKLMGLQVKKVIRVNGNNDEETDIQAIRRGDWLRVLPGAKVPLDGRIVDGNTYVDESMLTGESIPVFRQKGDRVIGGTINQSGSFVMQVEKTGSETVLANIIRQVREAQSSKAPVQRLADKIASIFVPIVIGIALVTFMLWLIFEPNHSFYDAFNAFFAVLVISCPCALGLATPTAIAMAMGQLAQKGILIKNAETIEKITDINTLAVDKTGTLTVGKPRVDEVFMRHPISKQTWHAIRAIERRSEHPLAKSIIEYLPETDENLSVEDYHYSPGMGVTAVVDGQKFLIGNELLIRSAAIRVDDVYSDKAKNYEQNGRTVVWVSNDLEVIALIVVADPLKKNAAETIRKLKEMKVEVHLLSGDNERVVARIAHELGISRYKGQMLPSEKFAYIRSLQQKGKCVGMAGDGINDAPALSQADVSFAMSTGTDIAIETANVALLHGDVSKIAFSIAAAKTTMRVVKQNLFWAFIYNIIAIPLAAGALYPFWNITLNPMIAGIAMSFSSVTVVSNSLRLKYLLK
ncbi:MAG: heavy metal translocating P-type ATPase [Bacteroidales bacterium]|nr:heavy metal translocating P-type ATPase [Bacteroidales bacterium]